MVNLKQTALSISIAIVLMLFVYYGIETFYPGPDYSKCNSGYTTPLKYPIGENCTNGNSADEQRCYSSGGSPTYDYNTSCPVYNGCSYCYRDLEQQRQPHDRNVFIISSVIGVILILLATLKLTHESISTGIMSGGVLAVLYGTIRYWEYAQNAMKFVALGLVLALLIWIGYKRLKK